MHTFSFLLALHSNSAECLDEVLLKRFSAPFVAILSQPWALWEPLLPNIGESLGLNL